MELEEEMSKQTTAVTKDVGQHKHKHKHKHEQTHLASEFVSIVMSYAVWHSD